MATEAPTKQATTDYRALVKTWEWRAPRGRKLETMDARTVETDSPDPRVANNRQGRQEQAPGDPEGSQPVRGVNRRDLRQQQCEPKRHGVEHARGTN